MFFNCEKLNMYLKLYTTYLFYSQHSCYTYREISYNGPSEKRKTLNTSHIFAILNLFHRKYITLNLLTTNNPQPFLKIIFAEVFFLFIILDIYLLISSCCLTKLRSYKCSWRKEIRGEGI